MTTRPRNLGRTTLGAKQAAPDLFLSEVLLFPKRITSETRGSRSQARIRMSLTINGALDFVSIAHNGD